jgi:hypothetical protein
MLIYNVITAVHLVYLHLCSPGCIATLLLLLLLIHYDTLIMVVPGEAQGTRRDER